MTTNQAMAGPAAVSYDDTPYHGIDPTDRDFVSDYPYYRGEWIIPASSSPSPRETVEVTISGSARHTQFPILVGINNITCDVMAVRSASTVFQLAYRVGEAPPGGLSSISNIKLDGVAVTAGVGIGNTGCDWVPYCGVHLGAQNQTVDSTFAAIPWTGYGWKQRHQGTAWIAIQINLGASPGYTSIPVLTCDFDAGSIDDWDGNSRPLSNPAAAAYYVMSSERFGFDSAAGSFNVDEWDAFADFCDADLSGEARWSVNGALTGQSSRDVLELILKHGFGATWYWGDEWHVGYLKTYASATATATQDDFAKNGGFRYTNVSRRKLPNRSIVWFKDTTNDRDDCRIAEGAGISPANLRESHTRLELCTFPGMALRWAKSYIGVMEEEAMVGKCTLHPRIAKNLAPYERLDISSEVGLTDSTWRVTGVKARPGGFIEVDVRQYSPTALSVASSSPGDEVGEEVIPSELVRPAVFGDLANGHTLSIDEDGHMTLAGDATVWEDLRFPASMVGRLGNSDPDWVQIEDDAAGTSIGVFGLGFDNTKDEEVVFAVQLPHQWKEGSSITPHVHWVPPTGTGSLSRGVSWFLEYSWANIGVVDGSGTPVVFGDTTTIEASDTGIMTAKEHRMVNFAPITATGKTLSSMLMCRLYRDVSDGKDNYADDAILLEFDIHYEIDSLGSNTISAK